MNKREIIFYGIIFICGFFAIGIIIILIRITENQFTYNYDYGVVIGFTEGIFLTMFLFFLARYENLKKKGGLHEST